MCMARKLGLWAGIMFLLGALGLVVFPAQWLAGLQISFGLLALVFILCGSFMVAFSTSSLLWEVSAPSPQVKLRKTLVWPTARLLGQRRFGVNLKLLPSNGSLR